MKPLKTTSKVCIIGASGAGKSTFANCGSLVRDSYIYSRSIGLNIYYHGPFLVELQQQIAVNLLMWELTLNANQVALRQAYLRGASAVFVICDVSAPKPFYSLKSDISVVKSAAPSAHIHIVANKVDLNPNYDFEAAETTARNLSASFDKIIALDNMGVDSLFQNVALRVATKVHGGTHGRSNEHVIYS